MSGADDASHGSRVVGSQPYLRTPNVARDDVTPPSGPADGWLWPEGWKARISRAAGRLEGLRMVVPADLTKPKSLKTGWLSSKFCNWAMLSIVCVNICVNYLPYYTFVPIHAQSLRAFRTTDAWLNCLVVVYSLTYVPCVFLTGPFSKTFGCRATLVFAMALNYLGCRMRCVQGSGGLSDTLFAENSFIWLVGGQALCALAQPFLVNIVSQLSAEWFPASERPAATMIASLMNFVGSSLSFMMPPVFVDDDILSDPALPSQLEGQIRDLLVVQSWLAMVAFVLTLLILILPGGNVEGAHRPPACFGTELLRCLTLRDFWLLNGQFMIFVAVCHSFDAVEGELLESYGYSASVSAHTAISCGVAGIVSTLVEAYYIQDPKAYQGVLVGVNCILALSVASCVLCLQFRLPSMFFVAAVGALGLATPGWGCSFEFGSEVAFPAREATVSSLMEAFGNLLAIGGIVGTQFLLDRGWGTGVLGLMSVLCVLSMALLSCMDGALKRTLEEAKLDAKAALESEELAAIQYGKPTTGVYLDAGESAVFL